MTREFLEIDHTDVSESEKIRRLLFDSYTVEARLIGATDFPPLRRTGEDIRGADSRFSGCLAGGILVAVAELETCGEASAHIASFAVHPSVFRQGVGTFLLGQLLRSCRSDLITVSTAVRNRPAISLYEKHGFRIEREWRTDCGIDMVSLDKRPVRRSSPGPRHRCKTVPPHAGKAGTHAIPSTPAFWPNRDRVDEEQIMVVQGWTNEIPEKRPAE